MIPHDYELAMRMSADDFDPHIAQAVAMGLITEEQGQGHVAGTLGVDEASLVKGFREDAKPVNYLSAYGGTYKALMKQTGWGEQRCKDAIDSYHQLNWSIESIADEQVTIKDKNNKEWLVSPLNGLIFELRSDKDRFNAVSQSGGAFYHFNWILNVLNEQQRRWKKKSITGNIHDELILCFKDSEKNRDTFKEIVNGALDKVNNTYKPRRVLDCDIAFGKRYSEIH